MGVLYAVMIRLMLHCLASGQVIITLGYPVVVGTYTPGADDVYSENRLIGDASYENSVMGITQSDSVLSSLVVQSVRQIARDT
jgi:hypothetical protein